MNGFRQNTSYLSVVAASRNDDHGGDPLIRTQIFVNNLARQCEKYRLSAELIVVDWNPVPERPGLASVLRLPAESTFVKARTITVPAVLHRRLKYADRLPLFQMLAKNVGIRRSRGQFVLATNIDILFSDELIQFIAGQHLDVKKQYRVDRYDIESGLTQEATSEEALIYAWSHPIRTHRRYRPDRLLKELYGHELFRRQCEPNSGSLAQYEGVELVKQHDVWQVRPNRSVEMNYLHTNACGDFTLLSHEGWSAIRGYPEFEAYSFNIDSMGLIAAHYSGYEEVSLLPPCVCFHIEHGLGSGWTPQGERHLFNRLDKAGILSPDWPVLAPLVNKMRREGRALEFNNANWGLADIELPERTLGDSTPISESQLENLAAVAETHPVSAIQPSYDLDLLTLLYERRYGSGSLGVYAARAAFYVPDAGGRYSEERTVSELVGFFIRRSVEFRLDEFSYKRHLRFDPCQCAGLVTIYSMAIVDNNKKVVWELTSLNASKLVVRGTAFAIKGRDWKQRLRETLETNSRKPFRSIRTGIDSQTNSRKPFRIVSTGIDPQLILPRLPGDIEFPVSISIELSIAPSM